MEQQKLLRNSKTEPDYQMVGLFILLPKSLIE